MGGPFSGYMVTKEKGYGVQGVWVRGPLDIWGTGEGFRFASCDTG